MPYIIETRWDGAKHAKPSNPDAPNPVAVATLDEARVSLRAAVNAAWIDRDDAGMRPHYRMRNRALNLPEQGGAIGPLPDGTVIEVRRAGWHDIAAATAAPWPQADRPAIFERLIDAYNAR